MPAVEEEDGEPPQSPPWSPEITRADIRALEALSDGLIDYTIMVSEDGLPYVALEHADETMRQFVPDPIHRLWHYAFAFVGSLASGPTISECCRALISGSVVDLTLTAAAVV